MKLLTKIARAIMSPTWWMKFCPYCGIQIGEWGVEYPPHNCRLYFALKISEFVTTTRESEK